MSPTRLALATVLFSLARIPAALAQDREDFETDPQGWVITDTIGTAAWAFDDTPANAPGGPSFTGLRSLNFNNGKNFSGISRSSITSPAFPVPPRIGTTLRFWCNFQTQMEAAGFVDRRTVTLLPAVGAPVSAQLGVTGFGALVGPCLAMGTWHSHDLPLGRDWKNVRITFAFDSVNGWLNDGAGWFIDTVEIRTPPYAWDFDSGAQGWIAQSSHPMFTWKADGLPTLVGGAPAYTSFPSSLNYNNGANYDAGERNHGSTTSPLASIGALTTATLSFSCNYETEASAAWDRRWVRVFRMEGQFGIPVLEAQLTPQLCGIMRRWHTHSFVLNPAWGGIKIGFHFDSVDGAANAFAGWFLDDVIIDGESSEKAVLDSEGVTESSSKTAEQKGCAGSVALHRGSPLLFLVLALFFGVISPRRRRDIRDPSRL